MKWIYVSHRNEHGITEWAVIDQGGAVLANRTRSWRSVSTNPHRWCLTWISECVYGFSSFIFPYKDIIMTYIFLSYPIGSENSVHLSQGLQYLILRLLEKPDILHGFIEKGGLEIIVDKLTAYHQSQPNNNPGLVSSLMNYLKLPPHLLNMSTSSTNSKKIQALVGMNGLYNFAPLCKS